MNNGFTSSRYCLRIPCCFNINFDHNFTRQSSPGHRRRSRYCTKNSWWKDLAFNITSWGEKLAPHAWTNSLPEKHKKTSEGFLIHLPHSGGEPIDHIVERQTKHNVNASLKSASWENMTHLSIIERMSWPSLHPKGPPFEKVFTLQSSFYNILWGPQTTAQSLTNVPKLLNVWYAFLGDFNKCPQTIA